MATPDLKERIRTLPQVQEAGPGSAAVHARLAGRQRRRFGGAMACAAITAGLAWLVMPGSAEVRPRGAEHPGVVVQAVAEGPRGPRPVQSGAPLAGDEALVFRVVTTQAVSLSLREGSRTLWPPAGSALTVSAGDHFLGLDGGPVAWTPDGGPRGEHRLVVVACDPEAPTRCGEAHFVARWTP